MIEDRRKKRAERRRQKRGWFDILWYDVWLQYNMHYAYIDKIAAA
jgi:hypothetical protein